jgi:hypothetical protein
LVLPQARWVLETRLRKLALDAFTFIILPSAFLFKIKRPGLRRLIAVRKSPACAISTKNKHLLLAFATNPRFHGGSFDVWGHTSYKALKL